MSVRTNATAVGAFVLGALLIGVAIAVVFGSGLLFKDVKRYVIFFEVRSRGWRSVPRSSIAASRSAQSCRSGPRSRSGSAPSTSRWSSS